MHHNVKTDERNGSPARGNKKNEYNTQELNKHASARPRTGNSSPQRRRRAAAFLFSSVSTNAGPRFAIAYKNTKTTIENCNHSHTFNQNPWFRSVPCRGKETTSCGVKGGETSASVQSGENSEAETSVSSNSASC